MKLAASLVVALVLGFAVFVRLAPLDAARWHVDPANAPGPGPEGSYRVTLSVQQPPTDILAALDAIAMATPRTFRLAGSVAEGRITYVTRSALWGFPDVTTVEARSTDAGTELSIFARVRFGQGDMGVNRARVASWLAEMGVD